MTREIPNRCSWPKNDEIYLKYHDEEWGVPVYSDRKLFEMLILEGTQAGLSWITILKRRRNYHTAYDQFDPCRMAAWEESKMNALLSDKGIVRNRMKISAARQNARCYLSVVNEVGSFGKFLWSFVHEQPIQNLWKNGEEIPTKTKESDKMSRALKERGFQFVGSTICYAYMQAVGMVNDHIVSCFRHSQIVGESS